MEIKTLLIIEEIEKRDSEKLPLLKKHLDFIKKEILGKHEYNSFDVVHKYKLILERALKTAQNKRIGLSLV